MSGEVQAFRRDGEAGSDSSADMPGGRVKVDGQETLSAKLYLRDFGNVYLHNSCAVVFCSSGEDRKSGGEGYIARQRCDGGRLSFDRSDSDLNG